MVDRVIAGDSPESGIWRGDYSSGYQKGAPAGVRGRMQRLFLRYVALQRPPLRVCQNVRSA